MTSVSTPSSASGTTATSVEQSLLFTWPDYVVFSISLCIPIVIGVFFCIRQRKNKSVESFLMGERAINFVAVALSILSSTINGIFIIGTPAEMHYYGMRQSLTVLGILIGVVIASHLFVAKYNKMTFTSAYEYVEKRFNFATRFITSVAFSASVILLLAVVLYVPAMVFSQVTTLNLYAAIAITGGICTIYTTIGGLKAVVYTDAVQILILIIGLITVAVLGSNRIGGSAVVWDIAVSTGRVNYDNFSFDPRERHTLWTQLFGQGATFLSVYISNQMMIQRYMAVRSNAQAQATLYISFLFFIPISILIIFIGLVLHATYFMCDPLVTKKISAATEIMQYFLMDTLGEYHGLPGLLMASMFAAALGTVSAVINALSAVFLNDYIFPAIKSYSSRKNSKKIELTELTKRNIAVGLVAFFGLLTIGIACLASKFTTQLVQASSTIWGVIDGPIAGMFIMGFFIPFCNSAGAISGMIGGLTLTLWIYIGASVNLSTPVTLPVGICHGNATITLPLPNPNATQTEWYPVLELYKVSYSWYGFIGIASSVIIGVVVSLLTGGWRKSYMATIDPDMVNLCCCSSVLEDDNAYTLNKESPMDAKHYDSVIVLSAQLNNVKYPAEVNKIKDEYAEVDEQDSGLENQSYENIADIKTAT